MKKILCSLLMLGFLSACSMNTVQYQPDLNLVNDMKDSNLKDMHTTGITVNNKSLNHISIRGTAMISTYDKSYAKYLEIALQEQLQQAKLYNPLSATSISGELLTNKVNAAGFSVGTAEISVRFEVTSANEIIFNKVVTVSHEWDSSFVGAIAIPNAQNNYPIAVQKLIAKLMTDKDFISSVHRE